MPLDRGLRFGMSVFETIAVHTGRRVFLREHMQRLRRAALELLEVDAGGLCDEAIAITEAGLRRAEGVLRIYITAGPGGLCDPCSEPAGFALFEECPVTAGPGAGRRIDFARAPFSPVPGGWKTGNYWQNIRALKEARHRGLDETVLLDWQGLVVGCACANLFAVQAGRLVTPALACGARPGVVREWIIARTGCGEVALTGDELVASEEIFFTNSRVGIAGVTSLAGKELEGSPFAESLARDYEFEVLRG